MKLDELISLIDRTSDLMYMSEIEKAYDLLSSLWQYITNYITKFINNICIYNISDIGVTETDIVQQLKNLIDGYDNNDIMLLADTLKYEIKESLEIYKKLTENS